MKVASIFTSLRKGLLMSQKIFGIKTIHVLHMLFFFNKEKKNTDTKADKPG